ncbi:MAG: hypothetical protein QM537_05335 [Candidatus Symbiobacter sp.]|nr:hypothetical protein [Candidatus Symbiobacter sp.]
MIASRLPGKYGAMRKLSPDGTPPYSGRAASGGRKSPHLSD